MIRELNLIEIASLSDWHDTGITQKIFPIVSVVEEPTQHIFTAADWLNEEDETLDADEELPE